MQQPAPDPVMQGATFGEIMNEMSGSPDRRRHILHRIEAVTHHKLIVYCAALSHPASSIAADDVTPFMSLLGPLTEYEGLDLLINSPGGSADTAEKIVSLCRQFVTPGKSFRLIVPYMAKSAATMIGLGTDRIVMGITSELGPIDPQMQQFVGGGMRYVPGQSFIDAFEQIKAETAANNNLLNAAYIPALSTFDVAFLDFCRKAVERSRAFGIKWLSAHMCSGDAQPMQRATQITNQLLNVQQYQSHGQQINAAEAKKIGLEVDELQPDDDLWKLIWEYYCRADLFMRGSGNIKVFESKDVSIGIRVNN